MPKIPEPMLTETVVADILKVSVATLQRWRYDGFGPPFVKTGRSVRYRAGKLEAWIDANERVTT